VGLEEIWEEGNDVKIKTHIRSAAHKLDQALNLGLSAAYPMIFNLPTPDPAPDWKDGVRFGWRAVKVTVRETVKVLKGVEWQ
jgi:hypothetical protein